MTSNFVDGSEKSFSKNITGDIYVSTKKWFAKIDPGETKLTSYREGIEHVLNRIQIMGMASERKITHVYVSLKFHTTYRKSTCPAPPKEHVYVEDGTFSVGQNGVSFDTDNAIKGLGYGHIVEKKTKRNKEKPQRMLLKRGEVQKQAEENAQVLHGKEVISFIDSNEAIVVLGQPGGGKTTFLKYLALAYTGFLPANTEVSAKIPIFIPLRDYAKEGDISKTAEWFLNFAARCATEISSTTNIEIWIADQLEKGNCLILVDGIDEVPTDILPNLIGAFTSFTNRYRKNKFVATCRTASYNLSLEGFKVCEVDDFDKNDLIYFSQQWFGEDEANRAHFINDLEKSEVAQELCKTPLLTTMMCLMYEYNRRISENRYELYESCADALMYKWDTFRSIDRSRRVDGISNTRKRYLLSNIARQTFDAESIFISKENLLSMLDAEIKNIEAVVEPEDMLYDFESNMGIFVERSHGIYCFSHLTFHEFFTALSYLERNESEKLLDRTFDNPRYREVFLLAMEKLYSPDQIAVILAGRIKYTYLSNGKSSRYIYSLLNDLLLSQSLIGKNVRRLLKEVLAELSMY